jgi:signal transduction histidine kinase
LETARQNLTESAIIKGDSIVDAIAAIKSNLLNASQTKIIQSGSPEQAQEFLTQLAQQLPKQIECVQLTNVETGNVVATTCENQPINAPQLPFPKDGFETEIILPPSMGITGKRANQNHLQLSLSAPVYDRWGDLRYALSFKAVLLSRERINNKPGVLTGSTLVIAEDGTILAHPIPSRIGTNIEQHVDALRLKKIVKTAIAGKQYFLHFFFENEGEELLAGYTAIDGPETQGKKQKWVILAVTSLDNALHGLQEIKLILIVLTVGLIGASLLASLYVARYLARPLEQLRDYALNLNLSQSAEPVPHNFQIREFNQLALALEQMLERLKAWREELEIAWEESKAANQVKSQFLATTSHELRNPLNIIINCIRLVRDDMCDDREEEMEFLNKADDTAIHLLGIINDLLDISKIEAGKLSVSLEIINLQTVLKEVINIQSVNVQQKGLQLNIPQMNEPLMVNADAAKLKQVLINIIGNATKFTDEGSITITTEIQLIDSKSYVIIKIKDTGVGIDPAHQHQLFRPFVMVEGANSHRFGGTGLGLAISRNLIEMMNGTISLESAGINQGTTITIALPLIDISTLSTPEEQEHSPELAVNSNFVDEKIKDNNQGKDPEENSHTEKPENIPTPSFPSYQKKPHAVNRFGGSDGTNFGGTTKPSPTNINR